MFLLPLGTVIFGTSCSRFAQQPFSGCCCRLLACSFFSFWHQTALNFLSLAVILCFYAHWSVD